MFIFYHAVLESIKRYGIKAWYGKLSVRLKSQIACPAHKMMAVKKYLYLHTMYEQSIIRKAQKKSV